MKWFFDKADGFALIITLVTIVYGIVQYIIIKRQEERQRRFATYHELIQKLVERESPDKPKMLDRQLAVAFELRNFREYSEPSLRILKGLKVDWADSYGPDDKRHRLLSQMDATIKVLEAYENRWYRF